MHFSANNIDTIDGLNYRHRRTSVVATIDGFTALICATLFNTCIVFVYI